MKHRYRGFTILELVTAVSVLGILLAIGVPSFNEMMRNNATAAQANGLVTALNIARSEASKRGQPVTVCALNDGLDDCAGDDAGNWANGWIVFVDAAGTAGDQDDDDDVTLQTAPPVSAGLQLLTNDTGFVRYSRSGSLTNAAAVRFDLEHTSCTGQNHRVIAVDLTGRINLTREDCT